MDLSAPDGSSLLGSMVTSFLTRGAERLGALRRAAVVADGAAVLRIVHELKGAAGTIGAVRVAELCREVEVAVRRGDAPAHSLLDQLGTELGRADQALREADLQPTCRPPTADPWSDLSPVRSAGPR